MFERMEPKLKAETVSDDTASLVRTEGPGRRRPHRCRRNWVDTASSRNSARAAWASSISRRTRCFAGKSPSKRCTAAGPRTRRPALPPRSPLPSQCRARQHHPDLRRGGRRRRGVHRDAALEGNHACGRDSGEREIAARHRGADRPGNRRRPRSRPRRGLIHRDIKPRNVWLETPFAAGGSRPHPRLRPRPHRRVR